MNLLRRIEQTLDKRLRGLFGGGGEGPGARESIELYRDALDQIGARATVGKRGDRVFPFDVIRVELRAPDAERRTLLEALFEPGQMAEDIRATLVAERVSAPENMVVKVDYPADAPVELRVICEKTAAPETPPDTAKPAPSIALIPVILRTLEGAASDPIFVADRPRINIGRVPDVVDSLGRPVRRNDLFFPEAAHEANATVSRSHAHIRFLGNTGEWRIYDDGSTLGTAIFRDGRRIDVPGHSPRGAMLLPGDEIYLGQARLRLEIL
jgi:pSer/pThr/pTyr-binding forkhead associated (FHA) protein